MYIQSTEYLVDTPLSNDRYDRNAAAAACSRGESRVESSRGEESSVEEWSGEEWRGVERRGE